MCTHHYSSDGQGIFEDTYVNIKFAYCDECSAVGAVIREYHDDTGNFEITEIVWA